MEKWMRLNQYNKDKLHRFLVQDLEFLLEFSNDFGGITIDLISCILNFDKDLIIQELESGTNLHYRMNNNGSWFLMKRANPNVKTGFIKYEPVYEIDKVFYKLITTNFDSIFSIDSNYIKDEYALFNEMSGRVYNRIIVSSRFETLISNIYMYLLEIVVLIDNIDENGTFGSYSQRIQYSDAIFFLLGIFGMDFSRRTDSNHFYHKLGISNCDRHIRFLEYLIEFDYLNMTHYTDECFENIKKFALQVSNAKGKSKKATETLFAQLSDLRKLIESKQTEVLCIVCNKPIIVNCSYQSYSGEGNDQPLFVCKTCEPEFHKRIAESCIGEEELILADECYI